MNAAIEVDGRTLEIADWEGARPEIVLLHEGLGSVSAWRDFPSALSRATGHRVVAYSRSGYGRSSVEREPFGVDYMHVEAERVLPQLLERLRIESPVLFGHSDGASIALIFAARYPTRVAALVLEAPHVFVEPLTVGSIAKIAERYENDTALRRNLSRHHADADVAFGRWSRIWLDAAFRTWNVTELLADIAAPVLVIQGSSDEYGTRAQVEAIQNGAPHVRVEMIDGAGHAPHRDAREAVLASTAGFIRGVTKNVRP